MQQPSISPYDPSITITNYQLITELGDTALFGDWFAFLKAEWLARSSLDQFLSGPGTDQPVQTKPMIVFRGKDANLPGAKFAAKTLPRPTLLALTADKALYRANQDTVRLLIAAPGRPGEQIRLRLRLSGNPYAEYPLALDETGCLLWSIQGLPEGEYEADIEDGERCRFEVAEYRLAPLNAELTDQRFSEQTLDYTLTITAFGQSYTGSVSIELQERGQRVGTRKTLACDQNGQCTGSVQLTGIGPYTLNVFAGERTATVALKGSEQERRETTVISRLGEVHEISLLPLPDADECRGLYTMNSGKRNEPLLVREVVGEEVKLTARVAIELLRVVVVDPARNTFTEHLYEHLAAEQQVSQPIASPYGVVLLGAFIDGKAWEGGCAVLRPSQLQLQCEAPTRAKPGARLTIKLKTNVVGRKIPVQLIVKDQRLIAPSDPQVELAASVKKNIDTWFKDFQTGNVERQLSELQNNAYNMPGGFYPMMSAAPMAMPMQTLTGSMPPQPQRMGGGKGKVYRGVASSPQLVLGAVAAAVAPLISGAPAATAGLTRVRMQFPEVVYNALLKVDGETSVEIKLGESMTRYAIEVFALDPETLDWQRTEASVEAVQPVYGELSVSPFVFPGDPVMGRLDVGASSGNALVEVRHDNEIVPLFTEDGNPLAADESVPSGSVVRFPVKPGMITALVRDASSGEADVTERFITEPGKLRHIVRRLRLLTPGEEANRQQETGVLDIKPVPGLERSFQVFVEGAAKYPFGCVHQTSCKLLAMYTGYLTNLEKPEAAREYAEVIPIWYRRLKSMYLPQNGFCMYPPEDGGNRSSDTYYAPKAIKLLLMLPSGANIATLEPALREMLDDIAAMVKDGAKYYKIESTPREIKSCHDAYQVWLHSENQPEQKKALAFVRKHLVEREGQTLVEDASASSAGYNHWGMSVAQREETAYAASTLLVGGEHADLPRAIAATNFLTGQINEEGRHYSTIDTAASLSLLLALRTAGIITTGEGGRVSVNDQEMSLAQALDFQEKITAVRALEGVIAVEVTSEVLEDWKAFKSSLSVDVRLERNGRVQKQYHVGDDLDLIIRVPAYEPGLLAHICLPDALARVVGGGQVKRFSLDFCEKNELRIPLAIVSTTTLPGSKSENTLWSWLGLAGKKPNEQNVQHWAVLVRNMFKEERAGNPGLLEVRVE